MSPYIYICGPMTGLPEYNYPAFHAAAAELRAQGWHVVNPAENAEPTAPQVRGAALLALLPGWHQSRGAQAEVSLANDLGIPCYPLHEVVAGESAG